MDKRKHSLPGPWRVESSRDSWTPELAGFLVRVGFEHVKRASIWRSDVNAFKFDYTPFKEIAETEALELLSGARKWLDAKAVVRNADPEDMALSKCRWEFAVRGDDPKTRIEVHFSTMGGALLMREFENFRKSGVLTEEALFGRRLRQQQEIDQQLVNAAQAADLEGARRALALGADPDADIGPLGLAAFIASTADPERFPILRALIEGGAALEGLEIGPWSSQPLLWAACRGERSDAVELLLSIGADPNSTYEGTKADEFDEDDGDDPQEARRCKALVREARARKEGAVIGLGARNPRDPKPTSKWKRPGGPI